MSDIPERLKVLIVEDSEMDAELLTARLTKGGFVVEPRVVDAIADLAAALAEGGWDLVFSDHNLPGFDSFDALALVRSTSPGLPFIILSGCIGEELAVEAIKAGVTDYLLKERPARLIPSVRRALEEARLKRDREEAQATLAESAARLRLLVGNVPCLVVQFAEEEHGRMAVTHLDGQIRDRLGLTGIAAPVTAERLFERLGERSWELRETLADRAAPGSEVVWTGLVPSPDGDDLWLDFRAGARRGEHGRPIWDGVFFDVTRVKRAELELHHANRRLRDLSTGLQSELEAERARIAREIHDDLGGSLTALKIDLVWMRKQPLAEEGRTEEKLGEMVQLVDDTVASVRRICSELHPRILDDLGIAAAIRWQSERFHERSGLPCRYHSDLEELELPPAASIALFRAYQEILTNIVRHAAAAAVEVTLRDDGRQLVLEVADDGVGIPPERIDNNETLGLLGMRERIGAVGGSVRVMGTTGVGTRVIVAIPVGGGRR